MSVPDSDWVLAIDIACTCADGSTHENASFRVRDGVPAFYTSDGQALTGETKVVTEEAGAIVVPLQAFASWVRQYRSQD